MMRRCVTVFLIFILFVLFFVPVQASRNDTYYTDIILDECDKDTENLLEDIGITDGSYADLLELDFSSFVKMLTDLCRKYLREPLVCVSTSTGLLLLMLFLKSLFGEDARFSSFIESISVIFLLITVLNPIADVINHILQVNASVNDLIKVLIPILAAIITASGNPTLAICLQSACLGVGQVLSALLVKLLPPFCAVYASLAACSAINSNTDMGGYAKLIKKIFTFVLSLASAVFSAILSVKNIIAVSADSVAMKGAKFFVGNAVPIVGGALSDSLSTVIASITLLRSTVGMVAVIVLCVMVLPVLIELLLWKAGMILLSAVSDSILQSRSSALFNSFSELISVMIAVTAFQAFICIISVASVVLIARM